MRHRRALGSAIAVLLLLALAGCSGSSGESSIPSDPKGQEAVTDRADVSMQNYTFDPKTVRIKAGGKVTWTNEDGAAHDVAGDGWQSELIQKGKTFSNTFESPGTYRYRCTIHPSMEGEVIVE